MEMTKVSLIKELKKKVDKIIGMKSAIGKGYSSDEINLLYKTKTGIVLLELHFGKDTNGYYRFLGWSAPGRRSQKELWRKLCKVFNY